MLGTSLALPSAAVLFVLATFASTSDAAEPAAVSPKTAATVNGESITDWEVEFELSRVVRDQSLDPNTIALLRARTLQQLIDRELVTQWLGSKQQAASADEVELAIDRLEKRLAQREISLAEHLQQKRLGRPDLERMIHWQLSWPRFLQRFVTDENLERYFLDHQADFDGRQVRAAHLLLEVNRDLSAEARAADVAKQRALAAEIRGKITAGEFSFAAAARRYSAAPTAAAGGDIGYITRHDPMPEPFSAAAFRLAVGEVSEAVESPFGVHLIECREIKSGKAGWADVRQELEVSVKQYLFQWAASQAAAGARIEFSDDFPHFRPGTDELVDGGSAAK